MPFCIPFILFTLKILSDSISHTFLGYDTRLKALWSAPMYVVRLFFQLIFSLIFALGCYLALYPFFATLLQNSESVFAYFSYVISGLVILLVTLAPTFRRCLGRGFLLFGVCLFLLPFSTTFLSLGVGSEMLSNVDSADSVEYVTTAAGAALGGTMVAVISGFFGFFLGTISLIIGLVLSLGGRREVVIVDGKSSGGRIEPTFK